MPRKFASVPLFDGVIHPAAGLFEDYFDVDKAADEHRSYIGMLRENGIRVLTVDGILNEIDIDSLRTLASELLKYDVDDIGNYGKEQAESDRRYGLSKMSRADLMRCILLQPTVHLRPTDNNTGLEAAYERTPLMNLYFTRDQSITTPRGHIICSMNSSQRSPETSIISLCYEHLGRRPILRIVGEGRLEGGDYIPAGNMSLIGCGMRTNDEGIRQIMEADSFGHDTVVVVRDHKLWQMQMHLDTYFNVIDSDLCTMVESRLNATPSQPEYVTCSVYARQHGTREYRLAESDLPFVEFVRRRGIKIIPIRTEDELHYANNFLTIAPRHIMAAGGPTVMTRIEDKPGPTVQPHKLYPDVPDSLWNALGLQDGVPSSMSCFLLQTEGRNILLDAGLGAPFSRLHPMLEQQGLTPDDIGLVYISHMHSDHIGGLLNEEGNMAFPKAEIYVNRVEAEAWRAMEGGRKAKSVLEVYREHLHLFEAGDTLEGGVMTMAAYGHTPGHTVFRKDSILAIADLIHGAALHLEHPEYCPTYDMDADEARRSRIRILEYARSHGLTMYGMHLPAPGRIENSER